MSSVYKIKVLPKAAKQVKRLRKKYKSFKSDLEEVFAYLSKNPEAGAPYLGKSRKVRMQIRSKNKGKSGGARIITYSILKQEMISIISLYDKSDIGALSKEEEQEIKNIIARIEEVF